MLLGRAHLSEKAAADRNWCDQTTPAAARKIWGGATGQRAKARIQSCDLLCQLLVISNQPGGSLVMDASAVKAAQHSSASQPPPDDPGGRKMRESFVFCRDRRG